MAAQFYERDDYVNAETMLSYIFDMDPMNKAAMSIMASLYLAQDRYGLAEIMFRATHATYPDMVNPLIGIGSSIRNPARFKESFAYLDMALEMEPENTVALTNKACMLNEIGMYDEAIELAEKSMALKDFTVSPALTDCLALASLGNEDFGRGFELNRQSLGIKFRKEIIYGDEEVWNGEKDSIVVIYGEQGIGDEIFYGSCIPDAIEASKHVIIDCDPRLEGLFKRSFPDATVYGTRRKAAPWLNQHTWDYRSAMADLPAFFRKKKEDFPGKPFLKADDVRVKQWISTFDGRPKIGIALRGGNKYTNREDRTVPIETFRPLTEYGDLVSLEYSEMDYGDFPIETYEWACMSEDYDNVASLVASLDYVVTTCTSVVHLAGALGVPCYVLRNKFYSWRYAHDMPWYDSVHIIHCDGDWEAGIEEVVKHIEQRKAA